MEDIRLIVLTLLAQATRQGICADQILAAKKLAYLLGLKDSLGGDMVVEDAVISLDRITATATYQTLASITAAKQKSTIIVKIQMACSDYSKGQFKLTVNDKVKFEDKLLPTALTITLPDLKIGVDKVVKIEGKDDGTGISMWGDISGKETV